VLGDHTAHPKLRILDHVGDGVDRPGDDTGRRECIDDVDGLTFCRPVADDLVEFVLIAAPRRVIDEPVVDGQFRLPHRGAQPAEHGVLVGRDHDPAAVGGAVDVRRGDAVEPGSRRAAHHAADVVVGDR
jgi:hypothetical protein